MRFNSVLLSAAFFSMGMAGVVDTADTVDTQVQAVVDCKWEGTAPWCAPQSCAEQDRNRPWELRQSKWGDGAECSITGKKKCCCGSNDAASISWCEATDRAP